MKPLQTLARLAAACLLALSAAAAAANTIHVPQDQPTIQAGINAANNGDTVLVAPGTYYENIDFLGKAITVTSSAGAAVTTIDGSTNPILPTIGFTSAESRTSVLSGFTITGGGGGVLTYPYWAGGVYVAVSDPTIQDNIITANRCFGIFVRGGAALIQHNQIINTTDPQQFYYNCTTYGGSGIYLYGSQPGGSYTFSSLLNNTIWFNSQGAVAGGVTINGAEQTLLQDNIIEQNQGAETGGLIAVNTSNLTLVGNLIYGNAATNAATALANDMVINLSNSGSSLPNGVIANNTITADILATSLPNLSISGSLANYIFANNLIVGSSSTNEPFNCPAGLTLSHNDIYNSGSYGVSSCASQIGTNGNISADPLFVNPNIGDYELQAGSPAIDTGYNSVAQLPATDLDGNPRIVNATGLPTATIDMGAYEFQPASMTTGSVAAAPEPSTYGSSFTLTADVTPSSGTTAPTGTVSFSIDGAVVASNVALTASGTSATASYAVTTSTYAVGTHSLSAAYSGDSNYSAATFTGTHTVTLDPTTSLLTLNVPPSTVFSPAPETVYYNQDFNAQGSVAVTGPGPLTGIIDFYDGTSLICALPIVQTTCATVNDNFDAGIHPMTASYTGDATNGPSTSPPAILTILPDTTTTTFTGGTPNPQYVGLPVTFTAVSTGNYAPPTGTVDFYDNLSGTLTLLLGSGTLVPAATGNSSTATFTTSTLGVGTHQINAGLVPSLDFLASASADYAEVILPAIVATPSTVMLTSSLNPSTFGQTISFTAVISAVTTPPQSPTGTVNFYDGSTLLGTSGVANGGSAVFNTSTLAVGSHNITAQYSGDTYYAAQTSNTLVQVVNPANSGPADFTFTVAQNPFVVGVGLTSGVAVTVTPLNGWTSDVALACPASLPYGFTCTFAQTTIAGGNGGTTLVLSTTAPHNCGAGNPPYFTGTAQLHLRMGTAALAGLLLLILPRRRRVLKALLLALVCVLPGVTGCAGNCTDLGTWPGTYSIPVTATGVGTQTTHSVSLQVQVDL